MAGDYIVKAGSDLDDRLEMAKMAIGGARLPDVEDEKRSEKNLKTYPIGFFRIGIAEVRSEERKLYLYVGVAGSAKFVKSVRRRREPRRLRCVMW